MTTLPIPILHPDGAPTAVKDLLSRVREPIDSELSKRVAMPELSATGDAAAKLVEAMQYAALSPGKRLRPALVVAACEAAGGNLKTALPPAAAVELLHAYTLVHDDLPALDNDTERRGKPTVHVAFDEATAVLVGDALLTLAFGCLADLGVNAGPAVSVLAARSGAAELIAGQALDLAVADDREALKLDEIERIHRGKTGALFSASAELGGIAAGCNDAERKALADFGMCIGIAFQHADDVDDQEFAQVAEQADARRLALCKQASEAISIFGERGAVLESFATWIGRA